MKRQLYILFIVPLLSFIQTEKELPNKIYYKDEKYTHIWSFNVDNDIYPDTAIFISSTMDEFNFKGETKTIGIYFDKQFKTLAVLMKLEKKDTLLHYQRYDRHGVLRMEYWQKNHKYMGMDKAWYSNGNIKFKWYYEKGIHICDTSYYITGEIKQTTSYFNSKIFHERYYYKNNMISSEYFWQVSKIESDYSDHSPKFLIEYDSITRHPNLYYLKDTDTVTMLDDGTEVMIRTSRHIPVDSANLNRKK